MKAKKVLSLGMAAIMTMSVLTGCGSDTGSKETTATAETNKEENSTDGNSAESTEASSADDGAVQIEYWHTMAGVNGEAMESLVKEFNETMGKEKGISVKSVFQGDDVSEKLKTLAQANDTKNFPNVAQITGAGIPSALNYEQLVKIEDLYEKGEDILVTKEELDPHTVRAFSYQDQLICMPFNVSSILLYYNKDMFEEVGLDPENPPKTIAEMAEACEKLMQKDGDTVTRYGLNVAVRRYQLANWIGGQGEYNYFGDHEGGRAGMMTKVTFGEDGTLDKYLTEWEKVVATGGYKEVEDNINEEFSLELFGMAIMSSARIQTITSLVGDKFQWATANLPKVDASDEGGTSVGGSCLAVFNKGDDAQVNAAWIFSQYLASPEAQTAFDTATGYLPVNTKTYEESGMVTYLEENPNYAVAVEQMKNSNVNVQEPFDIINWEIDEVIKNNMAEFGAGNQDKDTTRDNIVNQCNDKLAAYVRANG